MNFRVGQKVVCVDAKARYGTKLFATPILEGEIYTIAGFQESVWVHGTICVLLVEAKNSRPHSFGGRDIGYQADRFRPLVEKKTDAGMAILKTILDEVNAGKHREIVDA